MKLVATLVFLLCSSSVAFGQLFEAGMSFGASVLGKSDIGSDVLSAAPAPDAKIRLTNGFRFGFRVTLEYVSLSGMGVRLRI